MAQNQIEAFIYDVDGTFYHLRRMRLLMAREFGLEFLRAPLRTLRDFRYVQAYRKAQEHLRNAGPTALPPDLPPHLPGASAAAGTTGVSSITADEDPQLVHAARALGIEPTDLERTIDAWIRERPKTILRKCVREPVVDLVRMLHALGVPQAVYSDYPAADKLELFGIHEMIRIRVSSSDPEVGEFKPSPKGFLRAAELLNVEPGRIAYVGDRPDVDETGARAAGMMFIHVDRIVPGMIAEARGLDRAQAVATIARSAT